MSMFNDSQFFKSDTPIEVLKKDLDGNDVQNVLKGMKKVIAVFL
jgi:hypothetical protein